MSASFVLCIGLLLFYFGYRRSMLQQQFKMKEAEIQHQKNMLSAIIASQEKERSRIGMELHDEVGASLSALRLLLDRDLPDAGVQDIPSVKQRIDVIMDSVRNISHDLAPRIKGEYGFYDTIHELSDSILLAGKIGISLHFMQKKSETCLQGEKALAVYRVLGELVHNTLKHAGATAIEMTFDTSNNHYEIEYRDNGIGLPDKLINTGLGMHNIESRLEAIGAAFSLQQGIPGFKMVISLPL